MKMNSNKHVLKIVMVLFLAVTISVSSVLSAGAYDDGYPCDFVPWKYVPSTLSDEHTVAEKAQELYYYCKEVSIYYFIYNEWTQWSLPDGGVSPTYENTEELEKVLDQVYHLVFEVYHDSGFPVDYDVDTEFYAYYDAIISASKKAEITDSDIGILTEICESESNDNGFYSAEVWERFTVALQNAKTACANDTIIGNRKAFWDLYFAYNKLCVQYDAPGDIDGDGEIGIIDVTILQRALVGIGKPLNSAQIYAASVQPYYDFEGLEPEATDATMIQRYVARMPVVLSDHRIDEKYMETECWEINPILSRQLYQAWSPYPYF